MFNCRVEEFLTEASPRPTDQGEYLAGLIKTLSEQDRKLLIEIVEKLTNRLQKKK